MKLKLKTDSQSIFRFFFIALIVANLGLMLYLGDFIKKYVYGAIVPDTDFLEYAAQRGSGDINVDKFNQIIEKLEAKSNH
jgi:hypothetical protein